MDMQNKIALVTAAASGTGRAGALILAREGAAVAIVDQNETGVKAVAEEIRKSGHYLGCNRLLPPDSATTVRVRKGKVSATDGPWVETKEQLGGYFLIEARDREEAIQVAARIPGAWTGCVEVRPVAEDAQTLTALGLE